MVSTTTNYGYNKPAVNDATDEDLWGGYLNDAMDDIDGDMKTATDWVTSAISTTHTGSTSDRNKLLLCSASGGAFDVDLVAAATAGSGFSMMVKKTDSSANAVTIDPNGAETIDGAASFALSSQYDYALIVSDGSNWHIISKTVAVNSASSTVAGIIEIATDAEFQTGTDTARAITAANVKNSIGFTEKFLSSAQTITAAGTITVAHGLSQKPLFFGAYIKCTSSEYGWSTGDERECFGIEDSANNRGIDMWADATNIYIQVGLGGMTILRRTGTTGQSVAITTSNWQLYAWAFG